MSKFLLKLLIFSSGILFCSILFSSVYKGKDRENNYMESIVDKHQALLDFKSPKIILAGGSNLAFGINSEELTSGFKLPVVNLGLHAGLGLEFILNELKDCVNQNDIVFLSIEYFLEKEGDYKLKKHTSSYFPKASSYYDKTLLSDISIFLDDFKLKLREIFNKDASNASEINSIIYNRKSFNKFGDMIGHLNQHPKDSLYDNGQLIYRDWEGISALNSFNEFANNKKIQVYYFFPCYAESKYNLNKIAINKLFFDLKKNLKIQIINTPTDFVYSDTLFYDTVYHLSKIGRSLRTKKMIYLIKNNSSIQNKILMIKQ